MKDSELIAEKIAHTESAGSGFRADPGDVARFDALMQQPAPDTSLQAASEYRNQPETVSPIDMMAEGLMHYGSAASNQYAQLIDSLSSRFTDIDPSSPEAFGRLLDAGIQLTASTMETHMVVQAAEHVNQSFSTLFKLQG
ncbi:MAG: hypothetical protein ACTHL1_10255 [Burkholderiaceae bacterium]